MGLYLSSCRDDAADDDPAYFSISEFAFTPIMSVYKLAGVVVALHARKLPSQRRSNEPFGSLAMDLRSSHMKPRSRRMGEHWEELEKRCSMRFVTQCEASDRQYDSRRAVSAGVQVGEYVLVSRSSSSWSEADDMVQDSQYTKNNAPHPHPLHENVTVEATQRGSVDIDAIGESLYIYYSGNCPRLPDLYL